MVRARSVLVRAASELAPHVHEHAILQPARLEVALEGQQAVTHHLEVGGQALSLVRVGVVAAVASIATTFSGRSASIMAASASSRRENSVLG